MTSISLGPLTLPLALLPWLAGALVAWIITLARRRKANGTDTEPLLWWALFAALAGARIGFVITYHDSFADNWLAALDIRDGGFWWPGALLGAVLVFTLAPGLRQPEVRRERAIVASGAVLGALPVLMIVTALLPGSFPAPAVTLYDLEGQAVDFREITGDQPTLVNIWASWCPHCHRSMPVLQQGQHDYPDVRFVLANQGETEDQIRRYLSTHQFDFEHVLTDPLAHLASAIGSRGVPTTLIIDSNGNIIDIHTGGLSNARLRDLLRKL